MQIRRRWDFAVSRWSVARLLLAVWSPLVVFNEFTPVACAKLLPDVYWNSTNQMFRKDKTDQSIAVNIRDRINIRCPKYSRSEISNFEKAEHSALYSVSRWGYDNCVLTADAKLVGVCRTPLQDSVITVAFREFTPLPGGLEFAPGRTYYFTSTSNGSLSGLSNREGGLCEKNMKLKFVVQRPHESSDSISVSSSESSGGRLDRTPTAASEVNQLNSDVSALGTADSTTSLWYEIHTRHPEETTSKPETRLSWKDAPKQTAIASKCYPHMKLLFLTLNVLRWLHS